MKKKLDVHQLSIGMYVSELDRPWLETPFLFQGFEIRSQEDIEQLRRYCKSVYIDLPDHISDSPGLRRKAPEQPAPRPYQEIGDTRDKTEHSLLKIINRPGGPPRYHDKTTLEEEIAAIGQHYLRARAMIQGIMDDVRLGHSINGLGAAQAVSALADSVIRNPDALMCFIQLKKFDEYTAQHSLRVCILALAFGRYLGFEPKELRVLGIGGLLHDIGKMKIPLDILNKPTELTPRESSIMQTHVQRGVEILEAVSVMPATAIDVARYHHERYNGNGYMIGLEGERIGMFGMIGGIVDCYDAITSDRAYRASMSSHAALRRMYEWRTREFHPHLVEQFIQCMGIYPIGSIVELNTGDVGVVVAMNRTRRLKPRVALVLRPNHLPYSQNKIVDLGEHKYDDGRDYEIERVLEPGSHGVNAARYLPLDTSFFLEMR